MSGWELGLQQEQDLAITHGSAEVVADKVRCGADLRLYMTTKQYEETIYFQQTYAGPTPHFAGLMSHHHGYVHHGQQVEQPNFSIFKYDTSGTFSQMKWLWGDLTLDESKSYPYGVYRWFVNDRWRLVYEHDAQGNKISGDLDALKAYVREGRTIQVGIRQLFGLVQDHIDGPEHVSFIRSMQPLISQDHVQSNCDLVVVGAPIWPFTWKDGLHIAMILPSTSGAMVCFVTEPGHLPFIRVIRHRAMQWMVADEY